MDVHLADGPLKCISFSETVTISINISPKFDPMDQINNSPALVQIKACCLTSNKPLSEPILTQFTGAYMRHSASLS